MLREDPRTLSDSISGWLYKLDRESDRLDWDELIDESAKAFDDLVAHEKAEPIQILIRPHAYLWRLYERVKHMDKPAKFNQVFKTTRLIDHEEKEFYGIKNYSYSTYLWALDLEQGDTIDNATLYIPVEKLKPSQIKRLESMIQ